MNPTLATRMENLRARMAQTATDLVVIGPSSHMRYLADWLIDSSRDRHAFETAPASVRFSEAPGAVRTNGRRS